jgi:hypothetical protein
MALLLNAATAYFIEAWNRELHRFVTPQRTVMAETVTSLPLLMENNRVVLVDLTITTNFFCVINGRNEKLLKSPPLLNDKMSLVILVTSSPSGCLVLAKETIHLSTGGGCSVEFDEEPG